MPAPPETPRRKPDPAGRDEVPQENPAETERLVEERISELQVEIDALRRENEELRLAETECRRDEEALRREKDRVGAILSALDTGQSLVDPDMTIVWVNQEARDILPEQEPIGQKCYRYFEGLNEPCEVCAARRVFATGEVTRVEKCVSRRGRWMNIVAQPVKDASGRVTHVLESFTDITEQKQAEAALRESEAKYRTLVETALDIVLIHDSEKILYINPTGVNLLGASCPDEILGRNFLEIIHPDFRDRIRENVAMDLLGESSPTTQLQILRLDGTPFWVEGKGVMTYIAGTPVIQVIMRDITGRKQMEDALRESEERYRSLVELMPDAVVVHQDGIIVYVNPACVRIAGAKSPENIVGKPLDLFVSPEYRERIAGHIRRMEQEGTSTSLAEQELRTLDGRAIQVDITATPILYQGQPSIMVVFRDIAERKQAEAKLRAVMEREHLRATELDATLASIASGVIIYDTTGAIVRVNEAVRKMIDRTPTSFDPIRFEERQAGFGVLQEDGAPLSLEATPYYRALRGETVQGEEVMVTRLDREPLWVDTSAAPIRDAGGAIVGAIAILTDITERKRAEEALIRHTEELTRLHHDLETSNREANLYLDILTHDIGNTENVSRLYTDLLLETLDGEAAGYVGKLKRSINKSIEILGTVSTIRRIHQASLELKETDLDRAIQGAIEDFPTTAIYYNGTCHQVRADDLLPVVFNNLIDNAIKHGGPDVEVAVRVEELNGEVQISVEDTGTGVPDEEKEAIFHRYQQQKRGVGEGLGLYLVQILVERYGGRVWADDRVPGHPGEGAAFRFTLKKA
ncbi:PAS domain S-box protein [Methanoculleus sp. FWC-SCC3]|uniref:histidine kinase n=1 Tax=Methanoculleus methanifontis TaxID=2584086 RepID=A0ABT8M2A4_9EURY|nr:PAS domain S-box protein [Methanoculleus sp. FWC-SCC3]MDN7012997.1 PAS domain S-box protein [Methanoculleus sp. FWC-SCC3]